MEPIKTTVFVTNVTHFVQLVMEPLIPIVNLVQHLISIMITNVKQLVHRELMLIQLLKLVSHVIPTVILALDQMPVIVTHVLMVYISMKDNV